MKFVYVLVSSETDFLTEETLVSMYSLKRYNPEGRIILVSTQDTIDSLKGERGRIQEYVDEFIIEKIPDEYTPTQKSRFLKTSIRELVNGDFLYLDNDTIIFDSLSELFTQDITLGAVYDNHLTDWNEKYPHPQMQKYLNKLEKTSTSYDVTHHYNGGVIFAKDYEIVHQFFSLWQKLWLECIEYGFYYDQPALWYANLKMKNLITPLDGVYNCQVPFLHSLSYLDRCKILHYFSSYKEYQGFLMQDKQFLNKIRTEGINDDIIDCIDKSKTRYWKNLIIIKGEELAHYNSPIVVLARKLTRDFPFTNKISKMAYRLFGYKI